MLYFFAKYGFAFRLITGFFFLGIAVDGFIRRRPYYLSNRIFQVALGIGVAPTLIILILGNIAHIHFNINPMMIFGIAFPTLLVILGGLMPKGYVLVLGSRASARTAFDGVIAKMGYSTEIRRLAENRLETIHIMPIDVDIIINKNNGSIVLALNSRKKGDLVKSIITEINYSLRNGSDKNNLLVAFFFGCVGIFILSGALKQGLMLLK